MSPRAHLPIVVALVVAWASASTAVASPNLPLDDPAYLELERLRALGHLKLYTGGVRPLTEARVRDLLLWAGVAADDPNLPPLLKRFWVRPFQRAIARFDAVGPRDGCWVSAAK